MTNKSLFIGGTASHVGKSWFVAAFCAVLRRRGIRVAPFKAQNMSNNSFPCIEGGEIGRAQVMQAEACGLPPMADMNPVLLKPNSATGSQVVVRGKAWRNIEANNYYQYSDYLLNIALQSYSRLAERFSFLVCEGAGSVAEINLAHRDFTNLRFAESVSAPALLVADIERGGVFASLVGTMELLPPQHRKLIRAFAVNRFRGDPELFKEGVKFLEDRCEIPCLGVFPYAPEIHLDDEDSLSLPAFDGTADTTIAAIRFPHISNFTDFALFPGIAWIGRPIQKAFEVVFLPGTKSTIGDLHWLRDSGLSNWLLEQHKRGAKIVGICGGYQMLGLEITDPEHLESDTERAPGLGLLPVRTVLRSPKVTRQVQASVCGSRPLPAYEIHMGHSDLDEPLQPFAMLDDGSADGARHNGVMGTYLHGILQHGDVVRRVFGIDAPEAVAKHEMYASLADWLTTNANSKVLESLLA